ncbi:MAG TPA: transcriptional repressor [Solirubrobacteraceae bacterium]|jgi:Fur family ferric uptake transcriptional regulator|nr:transcriptional repressor [Solirubrobacteraceae bacterium]
MANDDTVTDGKEQVSDGREGLEDVLRSRGHRVSAARRLVLMALFAADVPVTAEQISAGMKGLPPSDLASIYRNLEMLEQQGLVYHLHLGHGPRRYRLVSPDEPCWVICERCDRIDAVAFARLDDARAAVNSGIGYKPSFTHYPIVGVCPACAT